MRRESTSTRWGVHVGVALFIGVAFNVLFATSCRNQPDTPRPADGSAPKTPPSAIDAGTVDAPRATTSSSPVNPAPASTTDPQAALERQAVELANCEAPNAVILNGPDGGVVFNNAMTSVDAGFIDRTSGVLAILHGAEQPIRCCLAPWLVESGGQDVRLVLALTIASEGKTTAVEIKSASPAPSLVKACLLKRARQLVFPSSPTNKQTTVDYPVVVGLPPSR